MKDGVEVLIDWMTFTVHGEDDPDVVIRNWLGMDPGLFQSRDHSVLRGYSAMQYFSDISVGYDGALRVNKQTGEVVFSKEKLGICISMSGNGCRTFERFSSLKPQGAENHWEKASLPFLALFQKIAADDGVHVTRVDVACDDRHGYLNKDDIRQCWDSDAIRTRATSWDLHDSKQGRKRDRGWSFYSGSPSSEFRIRIYDKALEQRLKLLEQQSRARRQGLSVPELEEEAHSHWMRCEMTLRDDHADAFVRQAAVSDSVGKLAADVLNDKFAFIELDNSNISRCSICTWWADFVSTVEAVALVAREVVQHPVEKIALWVRRQMACSLYIIQSTLGYFELQDMMKEAKDRLSPKQRALIHDYNAFRSAACKDGPPQMAPLPAALPVFV